MAKINRNEIKAEICLEEAITKAVSVIGISDNYPSSFYPESAGRILPLLSDVIKTSPGILIDIGCGVGFIAAVTAQFGFEVHCVDAFRYIDEAAIRKFNLRYLECNIEASPIPYNDNFFDIVILSEVIEHFNYNPLVPLKEIYRILKPDGLLFLTTPNIASIFSFYTLLCGENVHAPLDVVMSDGWQKAQVQNRILRDMHFRCYTIKEIRHLMDLANFAIIKDKFLVRAEPSTRSFPKNLFLLFAQKIVALTNSRLWGDTIYIIAKKTAVKKGA